MQWQCKVTVEAGMLLAVSMSQRCYQQTQIAMFVQTHPFVLTVLIIIYQ